MQRLNIEILFRFINIYNCIIKTLTLVFFFRGKGFGKIFHVVKFIIKFVSFIKQSLYKNTENFPLNFMEYFLFSKIIIIIITYNFRNCHFEITNLQKCKKFSICFTEYFYIAF